MRQPWSSVAGSGGGDGSSGRSAPFSIRGVVAVAPINIEGRNGPADADLEVVAKSREVNSNWSVSVQIWVDADACPGAVKELLFRTSERRRIPVTLVSNQSLRTPASPLIQSVLVPGGMNVADRRIVELLSPGDLVITADVPLAADVVAKGGQAIDPRGTLYTAANIGERLAMRNLLDELRGAGHELRGPSNFSPGDRQAFANQLDRWLTQNTKGSPR